MKSKRSINKVFYLFLFLWIFTNCTKDIEQFEVQEMMEDKVIDSFIYTSIAPYNLNVVYFIPKDENARFESHRRVSEILIQGQDFFKDQMKSYGFDEKSYNMLIDEAEQRIKVDYISGKFNASNYPYEGGGLKIIEEVNEYYAENPDLKNSDHYLILSPVNDPVKSDAPFYGLGKYCFAIDYNEMDIGYLGGSSDESTIATIYIGGLLHELGHGLNLPHNKEKVSDLLTNNKGTALMGAGNYTYGRQPTFLTEASCAILNNNQIFNLDNKEYYTGASATIVNLEASYEDGSIKISGEIIADVPVNYVSIYHDPADDNADYDAITWAEEVGQNNLFSANMSINELHKKGNIDYVLRLRLNHINGEISQYSFAYELVDGEPIINFGNEQYKDRSKWSIYSFSSEESSGEGTTGRASDILDGDKETFWHSCWSGCSETHPHEIVVDAGEVISAEGFGFIQRNSLSRAIENIELFTSLDNEVWESIGSHQLKDVNTVQNINLAEEKSFRYFKIVINSSFDQTQFASLAEMMCF